MTKEVERDALTEKGLVYDIPGVDAVRIRRDIEYRAAESGSLTMDLYYPPDAVNQPLPAVVFVSGYSDIGFQKLLGCKLKDMQSYVSWGQLTAASGMTAITYSAVEPATDIDALLQCVRRNAHSLGIDDNRIGVWACSGNVPNALSVLMRPAHDYLRCAVLCYGVMMDLEGSTSTAESSKMFGFVNSCAGKSIDDLPRNLPLFVARAGRDETPRLNETLDRFLAMALRCNLPITVVNHVTGPHAFDILDHSETSREIIRQILTFMRFHLLREVGNAALSVHRREDKKT